MKSSAAERRDAIGARQRIDAATVLEAGIGKDGFGDENPAPDAREHGCVQPYFPAPIAEHHLVAVSDSQRRRVIGMDHHVRALLG